MKIKQILYIISIMVGISSACHAMEQDLADNQTLNGVTKVVKAYVKSKINKLFQRPEFKLDKPLEIIKTPLKSGSVEIEAESVIEQLDKALKARELTSDSIIKCSVIITNETDEHKILGIFKRKKFSPKNLTFVRMDFKEFKVALEVRVYNGGKKQKAKL